ncbi:hypothetical protein RFI_12345, partial [Reticulomyxa filosa]
IYIYIYKWIGLQDISFHTNDEVINLIHNNDYYFAAFVRDPLERLVSGYGDKCERKRGVNLCDYARWGSQYQAVYGTNWDKRIAPRTPPFQMWVEGLLHCPCWPETDKHFAPQHLFCNLWQFADRFDLFQFENRQFCLHRRVWMERMGTWEAFGKSGWKTGLPEDQTSIVDYGPLGLSATNPSRDNNKYIKYYKENSTITAMVLDAYRDDYIILGLQVPKWICDPTIEKTDQLKRALRTLPRMNRPPCTDLQWLWLRP